MLNIKQRIATAIETNMFYSMIESMKKDNWKVTAEYRIDMFDKGIDFDFYQLTKNDETILFAWCNWFEGEIKASDKILHKLAADFNITFKFGESTHLNDPDPIKTMHGLVTFRN